MTSPSSWMTAGTDGYRHLQTAGNFAGTRGSQRFPVVPTPPREVHRMRTQIRRVATAVGLGLVAGVAGTAAMTVSSTLEARLRGRPDSDTPAQAVATVLGVRQFEDDTARSRVNQLAHWGYGTGLGAVRGLLGASGLSPNMADVGFHVTVWGAEQTMLPALDLAPPVTEWGARQVATDLVHHGVYSLATNGVYRWLSRR